MPVGGVDSVSVVVDSAAMSDILSTAIFVGGASLRSKLKKKLTGLNYLFIDLKEDEEHTIEKYGSAFDGIKIEL
jgi:thiamine biosynthesis lipoprotein ApbE